MLAYSDKLKREAGEDFKFRTLVWAIKTAFGGSNETPDLPDILK